MSRQQDVFLKKALSTLHEHGEKQTKHRGELALLVCEFGRPFTAEELVHKTASHGIHRATVYRDLQVFVRVGILTEFAVLGTPSHYFEIASAKHHHHFVCRRCLRISDIELPALEVALLADQQSIEAQGFSVHDHSVKIYGFCPRCKKAPSASDGH